MKKILFSIVAALVAYAEQLPEWVDGIGIGAMQGVGYARYSRVSPQFTRDMALVNAKVDLAHKLKSRIRIAFDIEQSESGIERTVAKNIQEKVATEVVDMTLERCAPRKIHRASKGMYLLVECKVYKDAVAQKVSNALKKNAKMRRDPDLLDKMVHKITDAIYKNSI